MKAMISIPIASAETTAATIPPISAALFLPFSWFTTITTLSFIVFDGVNPSEKVKICVFEKGLDEVNLPELRKTADFVKALEAVKTPEFVKKLDGVNLLDAVNVLVVSKWFDGVNSFVFENSDDFVNRLE